MVHSHLPLRKWFLTIYLFATDKRGRSALSLSRELEIGYRAAWLMLHKIRQHIGERDFHYLLSGMVDLDDGFKVALGASPRRAELDLLGETFRTVFLGCLGGTLPAVAGLPFLQKFMGAFAPYFGFLPWLVGLACFVLFLAVAVVSTLVKMRDDASTPGLSSPLRFEGKQS